MRKAFLAIALVLAWHGMAIAGTAADDIAVQVERHGALFIIDVEFPLDVSVDEAWSTLIDYDHMAQFISNITYSKVLSREGNRLRVMQKGKASRGFLSFSFENIRDVVLTPSHAIRTTLVSGSLKQARSTTRIVGAGATSRVFNHGEYAPAIWVPPAIGRALIESETREQFAQLRAEIMRRKGKLAAGAP